MTKAKILTIEGKESKEIELPKLFSENVREDIVEMVVNGLGITAWKVTTPAAIDKNGVSADSGMIIFKQLASRRMAGGQDTVKFNCADL